MNDRQTVLIVEDEPKVAALLRDYLAASGYQVHWLDQGLGVDEWVRQNRPDLILLDLMLPGKDGLDVCRDLRKFTELPIIMVTAKVEEIDRLLGLELGADDYILKPFSPREVVARVKAVLRRFRPVQKGTETRLEQIIQLDPQRLLVTGASGQIALTAVEFELLQTLVSEPGRIFSRSQLMDRIYEDRRVVSDRTIDSHVKKIRKKLMALVPDQDLVQSVYGAGYKYQPW